MCGRYLLHTVHLDLLSIIYSHDTTIGGDSAPPLSPCSSLQRLQVVRKLLSHPIRSHLLFFGCSHTFSWMLCKAQFCSNFFVVCLTRARVWDGGYDSARKGSVDKVGIVECIAVDEVSFKRVVLYRWLCEICRHVLLHNLSLSWCGAFCFATIMLYIILEHYSLVVFVSEGNQQYDSYNVPAVPPLQWIARLIGVQGLGYQMFRDVMHTLGIHLSQHTLLNHLLAGESPKSYQWLAAVNSLWLLVLYLSIMTHTSNRQLG